jgi:hypothetical protein
MMIRVARGRMMPGMSPHHMLSNRFGLFILLHW